jgi:NTE family protein
MKHSRIVLLLLTLLLAFQVQARPKVGLVFGGGGAKGAAEIGVLKYIERAGVPIDYIAGTSIGAIVGGLYASGYKVATLDSLFRTEEWADLFSGSITGKQRIGDRLVEMLGNNDSISFDSLPIPFRCVAADVTGSCEVVLSSGRLAQAIRASMAIPGVFKPVVINGQALIDGGMYNNLPVDVVRQMGADIVIAIDLTQKKHATRNFSLKETLGIGGVLDWMVSRPDWKKYNENREDADIYINPDLKGFSTSDFSPKAIATMIALGEKAGKKALEELTRLSGQIRL